MKCFCEKKKHLKRLRCHMNAHFYSEYTVNPTSKLMLERCLTAITKWNGKKPERQHFIFHHVATECPTTTFYFT